MKKFLVAAVIAISTLISMPAKSYTIGGEYARLISCNWGSQGYNHGYVGLYETARGVRYEIFFGNNYCEY